MIHPEWQRVEDELPEPCTECLVVLQFEEHDTKRVLEGPLWNVGEWHPKGEWHPLSVRGWVSTLGRSLEYFELGGRWHVTHWAPFGENDMALPEKDKL